MNMLVDRDAIIAGEIHAGTHIAGLYTDTYETLFYEAARKRATGLIGKRPGPLRVLDLGCGTGNLTKFLARDHRQFDVFAVDVSLDMLRIAQRRVPAARFVQAVAEESPFRAAAFDAIIGFSILHHIRDIDELFAELRRISRPGCQWIFVEPADSALHRHERLVSFFRWVLSPVRWLFKKKNALRDGEHRQIDCDAFLTPAHRKITDEELSAVLKRHSAHVKSCRVSKMFILSPYFSALLTKKKGIDRTLFSLCWHVDLLLSKIFPLLASEVTISIVLKEAGRP